jgi:hypothetical protein
VETGLRLGQGLDGASEARHVFRFKVSLHRLEERSFKWSRVAPGLGPYLRQNFVHFEGVQSPGSESLESVDFFLVLFLVLHLGRLVLGEPRNFSHEQGQFVLDGAAVLLVLLQPSRRDGQSSVCRWLKTQTGTVPREKRRDARPGVEPQGVGQAQQKQEEPALPGHLKIGGRVVSGGGRAGRGDSPGGYLFHQARSFFHGQIQGVRDVEVNGLLADHEGVLQEVGLGRVEAGERAESLQRVPDA